MTLNTFTSGINTSFSTELNANFQDSINRVTHAEGTAAAVTTTSYSVVASVVSGSAPKANAKLLVEAWANYADTNTGVSGFGVKTYDLEGTTDLSEDLWTAANTLRVRTFVGEVTLTSAGDTRTIQLLAKKGTGGNDYNINSYYIKTSFIE